MQILIITAELVLMATDSAVTVNDVKTFNGVQKIFHMDNNLPFGMMVNGPARFCGKSFKLLFDEFKSTVFNGKYTVENVKNNFIKYLENLDVKSNGDEYVQYHLFKFKNYLKNEFDMISQQEFNLFIDTLKSREILPFLLNQNISFDDILPNFVKNNKEINEKLLQAFSNDIFEQGSEIIVAGFEETTNLPAVICFRLFAKFDEGIAYDVVIHKNNILNSSIMSFGDDKEVQIFLNGINPTLEEFLYGFFEIIINAYFLNFDDFLNQLDVDEHIIVDLKERFRVFHENNVLYADNFKKELEYWKHERYDPILDLFSSISEEDLIELMVALINLTYYKRKYSFDLENVDNNVCVAVINRINIRFRQFKNDMFK